MPYKCLTFFNGVTRLKDKDVFDKNLLIIVPCPYKSIIGLKILLEKVGTCRYIILCYIFELY